jgi:hypothetical protein
MEYTWLDGNYPAGECGVHGYGAKRSKLADLRRACLFAGGCRKLKKAKPRAEARACPEPTQTQENVAGCETKAQNEWRGSGAQPFRLWNSLARVRK